MPSLTVMYLQNVKPGDLILGFYVPSAPTRPVQNMAAGLTVTCSERNEEGLMRFEWGALGWSSWHDPKDEQALILTGADR